MLLYKLPNWADIYLLTDCNPINPIFEPGESFDRHHRFVLTMLVQPSVCVSFHSFDEISDDSVSYEMHRDASPYGGSQDRKLARQHQSVSV